MHFCHHNPSAQYCQGPSCRVTAEGAAARQMKPPAMPTGWQRQRQDWVQTCPGSQPPSFLSLLPSVFLFCILIVNTPRARVLRLQTLNHKTAFGFFEPKFTHLGSYKKVKLYPYTWMKTKGSWIITLECFCFYFHFYVFGQFPAV